MHPALLFLLTACSSPSKLSLDPVKPPELPVHDTAAPADADTQIFGSTLDSGFGSAVLASGKRAWASAPHGSEGVVYQISGSERVELARGPGRLGSSIAMGEAGLWMGAPLLSDGAGAVLDTTGSQVVSGTGSTGLALLSGSTILVVHGEGHSIGSGRLMSSLARASSIAQIGDTVGIGMTTGAIALAAGSATLPRPSPADAAGFALISADLDGDGQQEWVLGAPGSNSVHIVDPNTLTIRHTLSSEHSSFGASLCAADLNSDGQDELLIGAPSAELSRGLVLAYSTPLEEAEPSASWTGDEVGDRLGTALSCSTQVIIMGAPGGATSPGYVHLLSASAIGVP
jgi:hypothetical protein